MHARVTSCIEARLRFEASFLEFFEPNLNHTNRIRGVLIQNPWLLIRRLQGQFWVIREVHEWAESCFETARFLP